MSAGALRMATVERGHTFASRNVTDHEKASAGADAADRVFAMLGSSPLTDEQRARNERARLSGTGAVCYGCGKGFTSNEPVYRARTYLRGGFLMRSWVVWMLTYCEPCAPGRDYYAGSCRHCERPVHYPEDRVWRRFVVCSDACKAAHYAEVQRQRRLEARQKTCQCGKAFTAPRKDTKFCSPACKQKAYRGRSRATRHSTERKST